jgi:hypothetical protein
MRPMEMRRQSTASDLPIAAVNLPSRVYGVLKRALTIFRLAKLREHRQLSTLFFHGPSISFVCLDGAERAFTKIFSARPPASAAAPNRRAIRQKHPGARFEKLL